MQEKVINTKLKEIYYYNPSLDIINNEESESINETWKLMNLYALQNYANVNTSIKVRL